MTTDENDLKEDIRKLTERVDEIEAQLRALSSGVSVAQTTTARRISAISPKPPLTRR